MSNLNTISIFEEKHQGANKKTLQEYLFTNKRVVCLFDQINSESANAVKVQLLYLDMLDSKEPIYLLINSYGGSVDSGMTILDVIKGLRAPVYTICFEYAFSMASILLVSGVKSYALPHSKILIHDPRQSNLSDVTPTNAEESLTKLIDIRNEINQIYHEKTGRSIDEINEATKKETTFTAKEALEYGLIDDTIISINDLFERRI